MDKAEEQYLRDEWHGHTEDGTECDCYVLLLKTKDKRIAELEEALQYVLLACETADDLAIHWSDSQWRETVEIIQEKVERTLDKQ